MALYYVIKYALSTGKIEQRELRRHDESSEYLYPVEGWHQQFKLGVNAFVDVGAALTAIDKARLKKIASLRKQIKKLEEMVF